MVISKYSFGLFLLLAAFFLIGSAPLRAEALLAQGFGDVNSLPAAGWVLTNNSTPGGSTGWFQGDTSTFSAVSGAGNAYIAANYNNAGFGGTVSNWLITPTLSLTNGTTLSFYTRTEANAPAPDALDVRLSLNGSSANVGNTTTSVGDFTTLLLAINSTMNTGGYASEWTQYTVALNNIAGTVSGRIAFHYAYSDTAVNGDFIGLDAISVNSAVVSAPEPSTTAFALIALSAFAVQRFSRRSSPSPVSIAN